MSRITFTTKESHENSLSELEQRDDIDSTAAAVGHCIEVAEESQQRDAELQQPRRLKSKCFPRNKTTSLTWRSIVEHLREKDLL